MNEELFETLEFTEIRKMLASRATSGLSKELAMKWKPSTRREEIENWLNETEEASIALERELSTPLGETHDIRPVLKKSSRDIMITPKEFNDLLSTLSTYEKMRHYFEGDRHLLYPTLEQEVSLMYPVDTLMHQIERVFDEHGEIRDDASPRLHRIRQDIFTIKGRLRRSLSHLLHDKNQAAYFQDAIITQRNGRYVVPIKEEYRYKFDGIVHDRSSTGQTLFMEPMISVTLNNDLAECMVSEKEEIRNILLNLTKRVEEEREPLLFDLKAATSLEFIFARGQLALDMQAVRAEYSPKGIVELRNARHPLIPKDKVVPITLPLGKDYEVLIITGSNAGGKTIAIKTLGLLALMNQAGLFIPASEGSVLPIYEHIYAIIGDDQSILYNLSTFSSYITHLASFLGKCGHKDLVLLDELGSGTDPIEGAALAESVTEFLYKKHVPTIITSHFSEMKKLAYETEGIENAFVEFNEKTLMPTYHLIIGVAGNSNAFSICRRLGLTPSVIERAEKLKENSPYHNMEEVMANLNVQMQDVEKEKIRLEKNIKKAEELKKDLQNESRILFDKRKKILDKTREESENIKRQLRVESEAIIKDLKKMAKGVSKDGLNKGIHSARQRINGMALPEMAEGNGRPHAENIKPGDWVYIDTLSSDGQVKSVSGKKVKVQCGIISATVDISHCYEAEHNHSRKVKEIDKIRTTKKYSSGSVQSVKTSINLLGKTVDEAIPLVDRFLNDAFMAGISPVDIIHGKGTGSLRAGIHQYLKTLPFVKEFKMADPRNGGAGVTQVYF